MTCSLIWFRRDLRLADNPALIEAVGAADTVVPVFVFDPALWQPAGRPRRAYLLASLAALRERIGGLVTLYGNPVDEIAGLVDRVGANSVHIAADFGPYGTQRDRRVEEALSERGVPLVRTGSPYAVSPGRVVNRQSVGYQVYTPFARAWADHGWRAPVHAPRAVSWDTSPRSRPWPKASPPDGLTLPAAGEDAARRCWRRWLRRHVDGYRDQRDRPDLDTTSHMSTYLKWGEIHPRTMLADIAESAGSGASRAAVQTYRGELAWREFYADVLFRNPASAREYYRPEFAGMEYDPPGQQFEAWRDGRTGFPIVDAGMRQLRAEGWMHNRVRMIVASFLVKDLHVEWQHGARHFMRWLVDGDLASNQHNWQWTAGCGTDAAPYFRVFNPIEQGKKFDPDGDYIRKYVPELRDVPAPDIHEPRNPIVDHATERREALDRYQRVRRA
jgi:deoxyribodipyrimidine photo-lyase